MDELIRELPETGRVLDLGAGGGSFSYAATRAKVVAIDLTFPSRTQPSLGRMIARAQALPLRDARVDVVVCNHVFEHFENVQQALFEINRVIKKNGYLWASIPNGFCFDDDFYRFVFSGGGHVNRFSLRSFVVTVEAHTQFRALRYKELYSGFVYLNPPSREKLANYPRSARLLAHIQPRLLECILRWGNYFVRLSDRYLRTKMSHYGWGLVFRWEENPIPHRKAGLHSLESMPADRNVCFSCGAGHPQATLLPRLQRFGLWKIYACPCCGKENVFFPR